MSAPIRPRPRAGEVWGLKFDGLPEVPFIVIGRDGEECFARPIVDQPAEEVSIEDPEIISARRYLYTPPVASQPDATLSDSLRGFADRLDAVPALPGARAHADVPLTIGIQVRTSLAVRALAADFGVTDIIEHVSAEDGALHTWFRLAVGEVELMVNSIGPAPRELRRPAEVTEQLAGVDA